MEITLQKRWVEVGSQTLASVWASIIFCREVDVGNVDR